MLAPAVQAAPATSFSPTLQEDPAQEPAAQDPQAQEDPKQKQKKAFARLTSPDKKSLQAALRLIEKGDPEKGQLEEGVAQVLVLGESTVPTLLASVPRMEKASRLPALWLALDGTLQDADLHLAWELRKKKSPLALDRYLVRRWADSSRKDALSFLDGISADASKLAEKDPERSQLLAYEAARGLAFRGRAEQLDAIDAVIQADWLQRAAQLRADFADINREPLAGKAAEYLKRRPRKEKLASLHLFELFGRPEQAKLLLPFLSESDTSLRLAAIDACRVVVDGEKALGKPSMVEIIQRAEAWKARL